MYRLRPVLAALITVVASLTFQNCKSAPPGVSSSGAPVSLHWAIDQADASKLRLEVRGLDAASLDDLRSSTRTASEWQEVLSVYAGRAGSTEDAGLPPMLGDYRVESDLLVFESQYPVQPDAEYRAVFRLSVLTGGTTEPISSVFQSPSRNLSPTTVVSQVYPSAELVPENLLKFYVHFSAPMSRGGIYDHIHLLDSNGKEVELPFLEIDEELWDPSMTRLTLIIDPGRIKRGVRPLEEIGPVLETGKSYRLVIDSAWKDGDGVPLKQSFDKSFTAGPSDREPVDPVLWETGPPASGTLEPLSIIFPESMDSAVTLRSIRVTTASGTPIEGKTGLEDQERRWTFVPADPWVRGGHKLLIQTTIEDLAGNNIGKAFDVDKLEQAKKTGSSTVTLGFEVR